MTSDFYNLTCNDLQGPNPSRPLGQARAQVVQLCQEHRILRSNFAPARLYPFIKPSLSLTHIPPFSFSCVTQTLFLLTSYLYAPKSWFGYHFSR
jgi:hypothetical protein